MEALHSRQTTGEQSGGQEHSQPESPHRGPQPKSPSQHHQQQETGSQKSYGTPQQPKQSRRQHPERKRLRHQRQSVDPDSALEGKHAEGTRTKPTRVPCSSPGGPASSASSSVPAKQETLEGMPKQKRERKPQRPGKYICTYCGRACAKPSVLQKHIRSHTGERPYPCAPCGFSFKTKSNLYKHRKSHTHRVKAGLAFGEPRPLQEQVTESEDETRQLSASSSMERQGSVATQDVDRHKDRSGGMDDSYAVKKRLAMRLSRGKHGPLDSSDEKTSSLILGSRGSTESGYFSRSESTEQSQDSPPNTSAKSYAEIILGKYGRIGQLQRMSRHHNQQPSGQEEKSIPFTVPKKQVIDHITKLITINEAVVDTSKIDSVKPRRFSLSRKSSTESQKCSSVKEHVIHSPKAGDSGYKNSGSITMGVPCEKFHHQSLNAEPLTGQTSTAPLLRSHSMPSAASSLDASSGSPCRFRLSQSFDERQPSEMQASRRYGMLRRQPAIEIPLGAENPKEEYQSSHPFYHDNLTTVPDHKQSQPQPYECEACGTGCKDWEGYKTHKQSLCLAQHPLKVSEIAISQVDRQQLINHPVRPGASAMRKRRKEESFESDDPSSPVASSSPCPAFTSIQCRDESGVAYDGSRRPTLQTFSVIQHTSSFEKQETLCTENQSKEAATYSPPQEESQPVPQKQPQQQSAKPTLRKLVRQHNVQVPEILVTEDSNMNTEPLSEPMSTSEKLEEFQWPQRSPTLAQLPIEKLPPKKKRLRLAEIAQSSGESSFDSISLPYSPSQDSSASYASSRSTSFEESNRLDMDIATSTTPLRRSRAPHMLTVPGVHQHREMRRSASEQAPHDPQQGVLIAESRSKSFDYSCLSPERSAVGWRERRKCLLMRHGTVRDPEEEEEKQSTKPSPDPVTPGASSRATPGAVHCSRSPGSPLSGDTVLCNPTRLACQELFPQWKLSQNIQLTGSTELPPIDGPTVEPLKEKAAPINTGQPPGPLVQLPQPYPTQGPSGAARAHYLPMSTGLKLEIPTQRHNEYSGVRVSPSQNLYSLPHITSSPELLRPTMSPAVAVRLQADTPTPACAIYTTLSQTTPSTPHVIVGAVSQNTSVSTSDYRGHKDVSPVHKVWSFLRTSSSGGNKRMLSPSNSIEFHSESQQQQKRVKEEEEEEEEEERCFDKASVEASNEEDKQEGQSCLPNIGSPVGHTGPPFTSLQSNTCNSWCYLNYIKPNPSTLDELKPSVYSSWSTSGYDPNPLGLSSKTALSLLHCKQRLSPSIYTMSPMSASTTESIEPEYNKRPCSTEVHSSRFGDRDRDGTREGQQSAEDNWPHKREEEEEKEEAGEEVQSSSRYRRPPQVWIYKGGKNPGVLCKHTCPHTDSRLYTCKHCNFSFKTKGNLTKHMQSKAHGEKHHEETRPPGDTDNEGVCEDCSVNPDEQKDHRYSDAEESDVAGDDSAKNEEVDGDEGRQLRSTDNPHTAPSRRQKQTDPAGQVGEPGPEHEPGQSLTLTPKDPAQTSTAGAASTRARRALFARRHLEPSPLTPSRGSSSPSSPSLICHPSPAKTPSPRREPSPPRSPPPGSHLSPAPPYEPSPFSPSPSSCHVSTSPTGRASPAQGLSTMRALSHSSGPPGSPASLAGTSAQYGACPPPRDRPATEISNTRPRTQSVDEAPTHFYLHLALPRGAHNVLSHLPLHSQQPARAPSLMIPIGGIHMIQPRTTPLYSLVSSPIPVPSHPFPGGMDRSCKAGLSEVPVGRFPLLQHQNILQEVGPSRHSGSQDQEVTGEKAGRSSQSACPPDKEGSSHGCFGTQEPSSPGKETKQSPSGSSLDHSSQSDDKASTLYQGATDAHKEVCLPRDCPRPKGSFLPDTTLIGERASRDSAKDFNVKH
ncbi:transcription factor HIVEP3 [Polymixia lowei]